MGNKSKCGGARRLALHKNYDGSYSAVKVHWKQVRNMRDAGSSLFVRAPRREVSVVRVIWNSSKLGPRKGSFRQSIA